MIGADCTLPSQPLSSARRKTASGGSRQRKPVAALRSVSHAFGAYRKNRPNGRGCSSEYRIFGDNLQRALPSIIGNTIGGLVADRISAKAGADNTTPTPTRAADAGLTAEASAAAAAINIDTTQINLPPSDFTSLPAIFTADALAPLDTQAAANNATTVDQAVAATGAGGGAGGAAAYGNTGVTVGAATSAAQPAAENQSPDIVVTALHGPKWFAQQDAAQAVQHSGFYNFFHRDIPNALNAIGHFIVQQVRSNDNPWVTSTYRPNPDGRLYGFVASGSYNPNTLVPQDYMDANGGIHIAPQIEMTQNYINSVRADAQQRTAGQQLGTNLETNLSTITFGAYALVVPGAINALVADTGATGTTAYLSAQGINAVYTAGSGAANKLANGEEITVGSVFGDAGTGLAIPMEFKGLPGGVIVNGGVHGVVMGGASNFVEQRIDTGSVDYSALGQQALSTGAYEAATGALLPGSAPASPRIILTPVPGR